MGQSCSRRAYTRNQLDTLPLGPPNPSQRNLQEHPVDQTPSPMLTQLGCIKDAEPTVKIEQHNDA